METVVFHSDIARLVLRYLQDQRLDRVSKLFCKSSQFLQQEFSAYKQGFRGHSFFPALEEIICEHVKITQNVEKILKTLPENEKTKFKECSLSEKINKLLQVERDSSRTQKALDENITNSSAADTSESFDCYKESTSKKVPIAKRKRRKSTSSEWSTDMRPIHKKRRVSQPFCFLSAKLKNRYSKKSERSLIDSSRSDLHDEEYEEEEPNDGTVEETDISKLDMPKNESTPRNKLLKTKTIAKALPEIAQAILDNAEFQKKLVNNINQALNSADHVNTNTALSGVVKSASAEVNSMIPQTEEQQIITSNQLLDEMVKNILEATERDPSFDAIIEEVVGASNKPDTAEINAVAAMPTQSDNQSAVCLKPICSNANAINMIGAPSTNTTQMVPPGTPIIIRQAVAAARSGSSHCDQPSAVAQLIPSAGPSNNSFSVFMDPSFSISKLVVMNSNETAQKQNSQVEQSTISIGNTTCEQILSQLTNAPEVSTDDQVFFDVSTGQLAFPLYLINDGLTASVPFVHNNEAVIQTNCAAHCINAPIVLPAASIESTLEAVPKLVDLPVNVEKTVQPVESITSMQQCVQIKPLSLPEKTQTVDGATPSTSGILNTKISKSLSTPRKRTSHVRTLSFSPANSAAPITRSGATPLSTRRYMPTSRTRDISVVLEEDEHKINQTSVLEKPVIKNVEILPQLPPNSAVSTAVIANESSNSCSVPPLFAAEESSNQTVIKTELSLLEKCYCSSADAVKSKVISNLDSAVSDNTPKRKQSRRTAVRRCKRQLSKSSNEEHCDAIVEVEVIENVEPIDKEPPKDTTEDSQNKNANVVTEPKSKAVNTGSEMEEWKKMRSGTYNDLDARMRAINAIRIDAVQPIAKRGTKRKTRTKRGRAATRRQRKQDLSLAAEESHIDSPEKIINDDEEEAEAAGNNEVLPKTNLLVPDNISQVKENLEKSATIIINVESPCRPPKDQLLAQSKDSEVLVSVTEAEKRTANIGYLLETPFKDNASISSLGFVPPTPGVFMPSLDTPLSKLKSQDDLLLESASYLFGSLSKSELGTPLLNAITPGFRFTPLVAKDATTPHSISTTEYSSGGSYYRPDESEDLDRNIDKILRDSAQKKRAEGTQDQSGMTPAYIASDVAGGFPKSTEVDICVEIPVETLKVAPILLKRVQSFSAERSDLPNGSLTTVPSIDPHYTLASGLPDICAEKEENADALSVSVTSSSSSPSSSSSSSSSDSSSSDSECETNVKKSSASLPKKTGVNNSENVSGLSLQNLSDISSTEDEDWQKLESKNNTTTTFDDNNSQLVGNDGEVRYPVRSWLTPRKENEQKNQTTIKMTLKSAEKCSRNATIARRSSELELKRERMKEKLKKNDPPKAKTKVGRPISTQVQRKRQKSTAKVSQVSLSPDNVDKDKASVDVLTALNLSAKKQPLPVATVYSAENIKTTVKMQPPGDADDNATSNVFASISSKVAAKSNNEVGIIASSSTASDGLKTLLSAKTNDAHRKCLQIQALPSIKTFSRANSNPKQVVRTPLGFKSSPKATAKAVINSTIASKVSAVKTSPKAKKKFTDKTEKKRNSPRLKKAGGVKKKKTTKASKTPTKITKRTTTTTRANKKQQKETLEKIKENKKLLALLEPSSEKKSEKLAEVTSDQNQSIAPKELREKVLKKTKSATAAVLLNKEKSEANIHMESKLPETELHAIKAHKPASHQEKINEELGHDDDDDDDPLEDCVCTTITESDTNYFFKYIHQESKDTYKLQSNPQSISEHLKKFTMNVAIDANNTHTWRISEEYCLFSCAPTISPTPPIRNIPKKRKIRITSSSLSCDEVDNSKKHEEIKSIVTPSDNASPIESRNTQFESIIKDLEPSSNEKSTQQNTKSVSSLDSNPTDKLEIEDIESILSHIHGAENT